jgi:hypothetical protein
VLLVLFSIVVSPAAVVLLLQIAVGLTSVAVVLLLLKIPCYSTYPRLCS